MIKSVKETFNCTTQALEWISKIIDNNFYKIIDKILSVKWKVIICWMWKSWIIWKKISATLASTWTPSFFIHPWEAFHWDLWMFDSNDIVICISHSWNTQELISIIPVLKNQININIIWITWNKNSFLAKESNLNLIYEVKNEWYLNLPPMASTSSQLFIWDLIASALMEKRWFQDNHFAIFHPWWSLWKKLLLKIENILDENLKIKDLKIDENLSVKDAIFSLSKGTKWWIIITNKNKKLVWVFTDWDLRRIFEKWNTDIFSEKISKYMTKNPKYAKISDKPIDVLNLMENFRISFLPILDEKWEIFWALNLHDLLKEWIK